MADLPIHVPSVWHSGHGGKSSHGFFEEPYKRNLKRLHFVEAIGTLIVVLTVSAEYWLSPYEFTEAGAKYIQFFVAT